MRIAVASSGLNVAQHLSECQNFNYYTTRSYEIAASQNIPILTTTVVEGADLLERIGTDALVAGSLTPNAIKALEERGIKYAITNETNALAAAKAYLDSCADELELAEEDDE